MVNILCVTCNIPIPIISVAIITKVFPSNSTKSPTEPMAATSIVFVAITLNACFPARQKLYPYIAEMVKLTQMKIQGVG